MSSIIYKYTLLNTYGYRRAVDYSFLIYMHEITWNFITDHLELHN